MWRIWRFWKLPREPKTHLTCWIYLIDIWRRELTIAVVFEAFNLILPILVHLTTSYEIVWKFLYVWYDKCQSCTDLQRRTQWSGMGNLFSRCFRMIIWPEATGEICKCGDNVLIILVWIFVILTTLCGDPEAYTYMTSWMESSPCVSIGHMYKERTFWNFLCIIGWHMLTCIIRVLADKVLRDLVRLFGTWLLSLALWKLRRCQQERNCSV